MKRVPQLVLIFTIVLYLFLALSGTTIASAAPAIQQGNFWCGNGSEAENYGFTYPTSQPHWTVGNDLVSEETMAQVDVTLDQLNADQLAQTMILVLPDNQVGEPVNCAVHFLRYMELGLVDGPNADNGFVWLFIVHPLSNTVEVRYGVGLGLNALTAPGLGDLKRLGVDTFDTTKSLDASILAVVQSYDTYVRSEYVITPVEEVAAPVQTTTQDPNTGLPPILVVFLCLVSLFLFGGLAVAIATGLFSRNDSTTDYTPRYTPDSSDDSSTTTTYHPTPQPYSPSRPSSPAPRPSAPNRSSSSPSRPSTSSRPSSPPARGGSGSGRSNRGG